MIAVVSRVKNQVDLDYCLLMGSSSNKNRIHESIESNAMISLKVSDVFVEEFL